MTLRQIYRAVAVIPADGACKITWKTVKNWRLNWRLNDFFFFKYSIKFHTNLINNFWSNQWNSAKFTEQLP